MKPFLRAVFILVVVGVVYYGWAKIVLLTLLIGGGLFLGSAGAWGIYEAIVKRRAAAVPNNSGVDERRATKDQSAGLPKASCADDSELLRLRKMAGLE